MFVGMGVESLGGQVGSHAGAAAATGLPPAGRRVADSAAATKQIRATSQADKVAGKSASGRARWRLAGMVRRRGCRVARLRRLSL